MKVNKLINVLKKCNPNKEVMFSLGRDNLNIDYEGIKWLRMNSHESRSGNVGEFKNIICPIIDAKRNEVYTAVFKFDGTEMIRLEEDAAINIEQLIGKLKMFSEDVLLVGHDAEKFYEEIGSKLKNNVYLSNSIPRASSSIGSP